MASLVIYSQEFDHYLDHGLAPDLFKYRFLVEGDSWMERSAALSASLPHYLARHFDAAGEDVLIINCAKFGDTMRRIGECLDSDFSGWVKTAFAWKFDAILLSAGGNDFIDAARDPGPGQGLLRDMAAQPVPANGYDCINVGAIATLVNQYLNPNFKLLYDLVQSSRHAGVPILLNRYDTPVARHAPAFPGGKAWLARAYVRNGITPALWRDLTNGIFRDIQATVAGWTAGRPVVRLVPTAGVLTPAATGSIGSSGDWLNEIHPNAAGWEKLAPIWHAAIKAVV